MRIRFALLPLAAVLLCSTLASAKVLIPPQDGSANINRVTFTMAKAGMAHQDDKGGNFVISPYNALSAMALVGSGAAGDTQAEFGKALFGPDAASFEEEASALMDSNAKMLAANKGSVELLTANSVWVNKNTATLKPDFAKTAEGVFAAKISAEDFTDTATVDKINSWASANTKGLIDKVIDQLDNQDAIVLSSALYFKGSWTAKFDKALTKQAPFTADGGKASDVPMMHKDFNGEDKFNYFDGADAIGATLDYGAGDHPTMRILLMKPKDKSVSVRDWLAKQTADAPWTNAGNYSEVKGSIDLPHIDIKQKHDLIPALKDMGITSAFGSTADFSPMANVKGGKLFISRVSHDVVFKTDEDGSEAAAVTTTTMRAMAMMHEPDPVHLRFDRSFVFALQDIKTNAIIFIGAVNHPVGDK